MVGLGTLDPAILVRIQIRQPTWRGSHFSDLLERFLGFLKAEFFVGQKKVRSDHFEDEAFCLVISALKPICGLNTEGNDVDMKWRGKRGSVGQYLVAS